VGEKAKDLTVTVSNVVTTLQGWTQQPSDVDQARYIISKPPGVNQVYSSQVHTWTTTHR
jgi:osmotically-inducible protein OsmY